MNENERVVVDPQDLVAPSGPHDAPAGLNVRTKAPGVVRFSRRGQIAMIAVLCVVVFGLAYGLGIFETQSSLKADGAPSSAPSPTPAAVEQSRTSTIDELAKEAPQALPSVRRAGAALPHSVVATPVSALAGQLVTPAPEAPVVSNNGEVAPSVDVAPPVQVPNPGSVTSALTQSAAGLFQGNSASTDDPRKRLAEARRSSIFVGSDNHGQGEGGAQIVAQTPPPTSASGATGANGGAATASTVGEQEQRIAFANGDAQRPPYLASTPQEPAGKVELWAGSAIAAELDTGINTDLPGPVVAHVVRDVFDSKTGATLVIPKGSRLIGRYNSVVSNGQARVQVVWDRLIWPDGRYLNLLGQPSADTSGNAGMYADVNDHRGSIITATILSGLFAAGVDLLRPRTNLSVGVTNNGQIVSSDVGTQVAQTGQRYADRQMQRQPELTVPAGENFNVLLDRTILLSPWEYHA